MSGSKKGECNVEGCTKAAHALGVCKAHREARFVLGCKEVLEDGSECPRRLFSKGRCKVHYMRRYRAKKGEAAPEAAKPPRDYGQGERFEVFTRIPAELAEVLLRAAGRRDGMYALAQRVLVREAKRLQRAGEAA